MKIYFLALLSVLLFLLSSCVSKDSYFPKPRLYPKVNYPAKKYISFDETYCSFSCEVPAYAKVEQDKYFFDDKPVDPCWFDLKIDTLNSVIHCSYIPIKNREHFDKLVSDAFRMVNEHNIKADYREDQVIQNENGVSGMLFEVEGSVATPLQFFVSDTSQHFLRGSLYFNAKVNADSIAPVYAFMKEDVIHLLSTLAWD